MNSHDREPLTPEEREFAQRLSRLGGHAAPSPALDAKILAAARAAVQPQPRRQRARWPLGVGIAASLALAIGIAWQLRPLPGDEVLPAASESESAGVVHIEPRITEAPAVVAPHADSAADEASEAPPESTAILPARRTASADEISKDPPVTLRYAPPEEAKASEVAAPRAVQQAPPEPPVGFTAPPPSPPAPPPPPAPPAPAAAMPTPVFVPSPQADEVVDAEARQQAQRARAAESADAYRAANAREEQQSLDSISVTGSRLRRVKPASSEQAVVFDQPVDEQPPASFSTPAARDAWLQRIRELVRAGELDAARASLQEFRRRHPDHVLPEDLKALLDE